MQLRDLLAVPFWALAQMLDLLAVVIGGVYTSKLIRGKYFVEQSSKVEQDTP